MSMRFSGNDGINGEWSVGVDAWTQLVRRGGAVARLWLYFLLIRLTPRALKYTDNTTHRRRDESYD